MCRLKRKLNEQRTYYSQREQWQRELADATLRAEQLSGRWRLRQEQQRLIEELHLASKNNKPAVVAESLVPVVTKSHMDRLKEIDTQLHHWQRTAAENRCASSAVGAICFATAS